MRNFHIYISFICSVLNGNVCGDMGINLEHGNSTEETETDVCFQVKENKKSKLFFDVDIIH